jgi:hypothetical protein
MWISKFVFTLVLMLVVLPAGLIYGSIYAYGRYEAWQEAKREAREQVAHSSCTKSGRVWDADKHTCTQEVDLSAGLVRQKLECSKDGRLQPDPFVEFGGVLTGCGADEAPVYCGQDKNGQIVPDGKGGCVPPPPDGGNIVIIKPD